MKIQTRLKISIILCVVFTVMIGSILFMAIQKIDAENEAATISANIVKNISELKIIAHEYLLHPGERPLMQWKSKYDFTTKYLTRKANKFDSPSKKFALDKILHNLVRFETVFSDLIITSGKEQGLGVQKKPISPELRDRLISDMLVKSQSTISLAFQLQQTIQAEFVTAQKRTNSLIVIFLVILITLITSISLWINKSIGTPIAKLHKGTEIIGSGNLDHKVGTASTDEIGQLSRAFDKMTDNLKKTTASIGSLKNEIVERKQGEEALRKSEDQLSNAMEIAHLGHWEYDVSSDLFTFNDHFYRIFRTTAEQVGGYTMSSAEYARRFVHPDEMFLVEEENRKAFEATDPHFSRLLEHRILYGDGTVGYIVVRFFIVKDSQNRTVRTYGVNQDITERKCLEEEREKLETQLQQSHKMQAIATLAGGIAHQFNNALSPVSVHADMLELDSGGDEGITKYTAPIKESVHRLADLTSQLLAYAKGGKYSPQAISLNDFMKKILPIIEASIEPETSIETDLPEGIREIEVDPIQIQTALSAVLENASESIEGEGCIRIIIENEEINEDFSRNHADLKVGPYVCIRIEDNGKGMDEETRRRIFEPFFTTKFQGRGLGLAAAYGIIENHGGLITIDSEPAKGTTARIYLPAIEEPDEGPMGIPADPIEREAPFKLWTDIPRGTGTILVIEDEEMVMYAAKTALEKMGYHVLEARSGKEAVDIVKTHEGDIDLAILDMKLPDMSGEKVYPSIKEARPDMKVIICSGYALDKSIRGILDSGAQGFIEKPFSLTTLADKLKEVLDKK